MAPKPNPKPTSLPIPFLPFVMLLLTLRASSETPPSPSSSLSPSLSPYSRSLALQLVEHASCVYTDSEAELRAWTCRRCGGLTKGFRVTDVVVVEARVLQAYVGVSEALNSVVVAFRGTRQRSFVNWMADLYFLELNLSYPGVDNALVHWGFYASYHNTSLRDRVISAVQSARLENPNLGVAVTGHSLGAALACLCALDLTVNVGIPDVNVMTFGQPRIGNKNFALFFDRSVPRSIRMTHGHDAVVHLPPSGAAGGLYDYYHTATEVWIYSVGPSKTRRYEIEQICDSSGEDPNCSRSVPGNSISDHLQYLGVPLCFNLEDVNNKINDIKNKVNITKNEMGIPKPKTVQKM